MIDILNEDEGGVGITAYREKSNGPVWISLGCAMGDDVTITVAQARILIRLLEKAIKMAEK